MSNITNENDIITKLDYIGLDLEDIPDFLKQAVSFEYRPLKVIDESNYKVYRYIPISEIQILLTPCNRLNTVQEKYGKANSISSYLDSKTEDNIVRYTTFLKMLKEVKIDEIEELKKQQENLQNQEPFLVKFHENYLWQIYYSDIENKYFMLVPTEDLDYAAFFYLLKKQIELKKNKTEEYIYVPISHEQYSGEYLKSSQISDLEKYIWYFTKEWPITYEVYDKNNIMSIQIVGKTIVYEGIQSEYKIKLKTIEEAEKFYKLLKALFILSNELPHYYNFEMKIKQDGGLECVYQNKIITYDTLMELLRVEYENAKKQITELQNKKKTLEIELKSKKLEAMKKEKEYLTKEKQIATYLECKKTFFGKVRYFFKAKKIKKNLNQEIQEEGIKLQEDNIEETQEIKFVNKEYYTIEDIVQIYKNLDKISQKVKDLQLDLEAQRRKIVSLSKKTENATLYIEEIDKHEKSIFEFWKFANKDEQALLQEGQEEVVNNDKKLEKVFSYQEDYEEIGILIDKKQRKILSKEETDSIFISTTELLDVLNDYENEEKFVNSLENLKKQAENERILFSQENFDLFGNVAGDNTKIQVLAGKKHRENKKDKLKVLEITKNTTLEEYKDKILEILKNLYESFEKSGSLVSIPVYYAAQQKLEELPMQVFSINPEEAIEDKKEEKTINLYRLNIKEKMPIIYFTNNIYYDNHNKTLPLGMNVTSKCLIRLNDYELIQKQKREFRIANLIDEFNIEITNIHVYEYDIRKKEKE